MCLAWQSWIDVCWRGGANPNTSWQDISSSFSYLLNTFFILWSSDGDAVTVSDGMVSIVVTTWFWCSGIIFKAENWSRQSVSSDHSWGFGYSEQLQLSILQVRINKQVYVSPVSAGGGGMLEAPRSRWMLQIHARATMHLFPCLLSEQMFPGVSVRIFWTPEQDCRDYWEAVRFWVK